MPGLPGTAWGSSQPGLEGSVPQALVASGPSSLPTPGHLSKVQGPHMAARGLWPQGGWCQRPDRAGILRVFFHMRDARSSTQPPMTRSTPLLPEYHQEKQSPSQPIGISRKCLSEPKCHVLSPEHDISELRDLKFQSMDRNSLITPTAFVWKARPPRAAPARPLPVQRSVALTPRVTSWSPVTRCWIPGAPQPNRTPFLRCLA